MHPTCSDCGATAPETTTNYTLISSTFGWRLTREGTDRVARWRCPACWRAFKEQHSPRAPNAGTPKGAPGKDAKDAKKSGK
jgi:hypothetical protein